MTGSVGELFHQPVNPHAAVRGGVSDGTGGYFERNTSSCVSRKMT